MNLDYFGLSSMLSQKWAATSQNKAVSARAHKVYVPDLAPEIKVPAAHHTDSLGDKHRQGEGLCGSGSGTSRQRIVI